MVVTDALSAVTRVGRVMRIRSTINSTTFYFDHLAEVSDGVPLDTLGVQVNVTAALQRLPWELFTSIVSQVLKSSFHSVPLISDQAYMRELMQLAVSDDLLGPAGGSYEEVIDISVMDRYIVGKLAPMHTVMMPEKIEGMGDGGDYGDEGDGDDLDTSSNVSWVPSSIGFTFCIEENLQSMELEASWGKYLREPSEFATDDSGKPLQCWKRKPAGGKTTINLQATSVIDPITIDHDHPDICIRGTISPALPNKMGRLVTIFLVNQQENLKQLRDLNWMFQPEITVYSKEGGAFFRRRPILDFNDGSTVHDPERNTLEMIYRRKMEFAVGHGISVHVNVSESDSEAATEIKTVVLPEYEVPVTEVPGVNPEDRSAMRQIYADGTLDMTRLAELATVENRPDLISSLKVLTVDYAAWIKENTAEAENLLESYKEYGLHALILQYGVGSPQSEVL